MAQQSELKRTICVNRDRQTHDTARFSADMVAAIDTQQSPAAPLDKTSELAARTAPSYGDFNNPLRAAGLGLGDID